MEYYVLSKKGSREINEDAAGVMAVESGFVCVLADGLGGHDKGEVASSMVKEHALRLFEEMEWLSKAELEDYLKRCFQEGQEQLMAAQKETANEMKTTMVVLASANHQLQWGHIGDSRLYQFKNGKLIKRTLDHSVPQMLVMTGEIKEKQIRGHEDRNRLLRVMGSEWNSPKYELADMEQAESGQAYLLCSDGFWELIEEKTMLQCLRHSATPKEWLEAMEHEVLKNGQGTDMDNYTAIAVFLGKQEVKKKFFGLF